MPSCTSIENERGSKRAIFTYPPVIEKGWQDVNSGYQNIRYPPVLADYDLGKR